MDPLSIIPLLASVMEF